MLIEQIVDVPENSKITIELPSSLKKSKKLKLTINDIDNSLETKISLLKQASSDKDFLADLQEVNYDFAFVKSNVL